MTEWGGGGDDEEEEEEEEEDGSNSDSDEMVQWERAGMVQGYQPSTNKT